MSIMDMDLGLQGLDQEYALQVPGVPTNLMHDSGGQTAGAIIWDIMAGAATYDVQASPDNITFTTVSANQVSNKYTYSNSSGTYYLRVEADNAAGNSGYCTSIQIVLP